MCSLQPRCDTPTVRRPRQSWVVPTTVRGADSRVCVHARARAEAHAGRHGRAVRKLVGGAAASARHGSCSSRPTPRARSDDPEEGQPRPVPPEEVFHLERRPRAASAGAQASGSRRGPLLAAGGRLQFGLALLHVGVRRRDLARHGVGVPFRFLQCAGSAWPRCGWGFNMPAAHSQFQPIAPPSLRWGCAPGAARAAARCEPGGLR